MAYVSDETGQNEVYLTSLPEGKVKWKVSATGGAYPAWTANGRATSSPMVVGIEIIVGVHQHSNRLEMIHDSNRITFLLI